MSNVKEYKDIIAFHPGYYILEIIEDMGITQSEFALRMGTTTKTLSYLINGQANISNDLAKKLSIMMGTSTEVWLNLQKEYDKKLIDIQKEKDYDEQVNIVSLIDYKYFVDVANLPSVKTKKDKIINLCQFLKISDLRILLKQDFLVNYRTGVSVVSDKNIINSKAWLQTAINFSKNIETNPYNEKKLKSYLPELRSMTIQDPNVFLPRMKQIFSDCGIAFVLLPHLKNSGVNGAVKWIDENRVVLAMNNRKLDADVFWFSLFHEIQHVFQKKLKTTFIRFNEKEMDEMNKQFEDEADTFSKNLLIPPKDLSAFSPTKYTTDEDIIKFADEIGIHPGIVVGRLQHEGILPQYRCADLKEKYQIR